jgi:hypothetical protein
VDPFDVGRRSIAARAAALIPIPAFIQRRLGTQVPGDAGAVVGLTQAAESSGVLLAKAGALLAAAAFVGGGMQVAGSDPDAPERILPDAAPAKQDGLSKPGDRGPARTEPGRSGTALGDGTRSTAPRTGSGPGAGGHQVAPAPQQTGPDSAPDVPADPARPGPATPPLGEVEESPPADRTGSGQLRLRIPEVQSQSSSQGWTLEGAQQNLPDLGATAATAVDGA